MSLQGVKKLISPKASNSKGGKGQKNNVDKSEQNPKSNTVAKAKPNQDDRIEVMEEESNQTVIGFCATCKQNVVEDNAVQNSMIECGRCAQWVCRLCTSMSTEQLKFLASSDRFHWFCDECDLIAIAAIESSKKLDKKVSVTPAEVQKSVISRMIKIVDNFEHKLEQQVKVVTEGSKKTYAQALTEGVIPQISSIQKDLKRINTDQSKAVDEAKDRESRKNNLIVFGIPESKDEDINVRKAHDETKFKEVCTIGMEIEVEVSSVTRLRTKNENGPKPMRVKLRNEEDKWKVLRHTKNRAKAGDNMKIVYIKKDMTLLERERDFELRKLLQEKRQEATRENNGKVWIIRRGKVIDVTRKTIQHTEDQTQKTTAQIH